MTATIIPLINQEILKLVHLVEIPHCADQKAVGGYTSHTSIAKYLFILQ